MSGCVVLRCLLELIHNKRYVNNFTIRVQDLSLKWTPSTGRRKLQLKMKPDTSFPFHKDYHSPGRMDHSLVSHLKTLTWKQLPWNKPETPFKAKSNFHIFLTTSQGSDVLCLNKDWLFTIRSYEARFDIKFPETTKEHSHCFCLGLHSLTEQPCCTKHLSPTYQSHLQTLLQATLQIHKAFQQQQSIL